MPIHSVVAGAVATAGVVAACAWWVTPDSNKADAAPSAGAGAGIVSLPPPSSTDGEGYAATECFVRTTNGRDREGVVVFWLGASFRESLVTYCQARSLDYRTFVDSQPPHGMIWRATATVGRDGYASFSEGESVEIYLYCTATGKMNWSEDTDAMEQGSVVITAIDSVPYDWQDEPPR